MLLKGIQAQHLTMIARTGGLDALAHASHLFVELPAAVEHARAHVHRDDQVTGPICGRTADRTQATLT